ncbi:bacterio-opsin activator [Hydrogenobaculum acidophilum]
MITLNGVVENEQDLERLVERVFLKAIDLLGGLSKLSEFRTLTWLPSLARASYVIVLKEEYIKPEEEIAAKVGLTKNTVKNILRADPTLAMEKIKKLEELTKEEAKELKVHTAGGIAKLAYKLVKDGQDAQSLMHYCSLIAQDILRDLDVPWAYLVLKNTKGIKYPIVDGNTLQEKLKNVKIKNMKIEDILKSIHYPIKTPATLIHEIKQAINEQQ